MWEDLLNFINSKNPYKWMITFDGGNIVTLEYFGEEYFGVLESGCGLWRVTGTMQNILEAIRE